MRHIFHKCRPPRGRRWLSRLTTSALTTTLLSRQSPSSSYLSLMLLPQCAALPSISSMASSRRKSSSISGQQTSMEQEMTRDALEIVKKGIQAVNPYDAVKAHFCAVDENTLKIGKDDTLNLHQYDEVVLVAFGKASSAMASTVLQQLNGRIKTSGLVICKDDHGTPEEIETLVDANVKIQYASHPVPDARSVQGAAALMDLVRSRRSERTLVICCISGGGSALFCQPTDPLTLDDLQSVNSILLASGMGIQEMNVIRKRLEEGKGGRLAAQCFPSQLVTLILSDVLGDPLDLIASGPTLPDTSTWKDAWGLVQQYNLENSLPDSVVNILKNGTSGGLVDSPLPDDEYFRQAKTVLVGNNALAVEAAAHQARELGYHPVILGTQVEGEAREIPHIYTAMALHLQQGEGDSSPFPLAPSLPVALIAGGETTVSMPHNCQGKGGRNQELALSAALMLEKLSLRNVVVASVGTDGTDGPTDAAGAVVDGTTVQQQLEQARAALSNHDAYTFFEELAKIESSPAIPPLIKTGPTGTNVADIAVTLVGKYP